MIAPKGPMEGQESYWLRGLLQERPLPRQPSLDTRGPHPHFRLERTSGNTMSWGTQGLRDVSLDAYPWQGRPWQKPERRVQKVAPLPPNCRSPSSGRCGLWLGAWAPTACPCPSLGQHCGEPGQSRGGGGGLEPQALRCLGADTVPSVTGPLAPTAPSGAILGKTFHPVSISGQRRQLQGQPSP